MEIVEYKKELKTSGPEEVVFKAFSTLVNAELPGVFKRAGKEELQRTVALAESAFTVYRSVTGERRAQFLEEIAEEIMNLGDDLIERCCKESGLPASRIIGERARTCHQLRLFAQLLREGWWVDARIDTPDPQRKPVAKPDVRRMLMPIGPVAVFGASNFPLAFSTAGGDTASALAAGCPVIVKAHSSHPGTNELVSAAITRAIQKTGMPEHVFTSIHLSHEHGISLVQEPSIKAVGFTGSRHVGMLLFNSAVQRPDPIPVYAEMSSINPFVILEGALQENADQIAKGLATSLTLGAGQFCTNPGLVLAVESEALSLFLREFASELETIQAAPMLNRNIYKAYEQGIAAWQNQNGVVPISTTKPNEAEKKYHAQPMAFTVAGDEFLQNKNLTHEVFGPAALIVICKSFSQLQQILHTLEGQLTVTIHGSSDDTALVTDILHLVTLKAGRVIYGGYPTGVEVGHAMQHGGPFPATTDGRSTSVGTAAIYRFVRPVAFQDFPDHMLPEALQNDNPLQISRLINGGWTKDKL